ncbi:acyl-CoA dehydrogenase family protein [Petropleomorpha daqingensis]|uniref:Alkylation response protein AidB-like acyl-CoA dehydrogenase n=1 Tax=Petropleomorpha daqingensis TaxID=2026353 RepID=A0A853CLJ5_9ACTN|nr:alkylation response protein AidB-like acyl-CoA dehydrogenase [Petropleomorpha daqingensis]
MLGSGDVEAVATAFGELLDGGWGVPLPGMGATAARWRSFAALGERSLPLARLAEGHADALAVLTELDGQLPERGSRLGVWAAEPPTARLSARWTGTEWRLDGRKAWCSGARVLTGALVTATADDGARLFLVDLTGGGLEVDPSAWAGPGMHASDTADVTFTDVPATPIGPPGGYVGRPGFWHGGIGVAAVWFGGARGVAGALQRAAAEREPDPLLDLALGSCAIALGTAQAVLDAAAGEIDAVPVDLPAARLRALRVRAVVARVAEEVLTTVGHALGAAPLAHDGEHAARVADLTVYLRQHHAERDVAALGAALREENRT